MFFLREPLVHIFSTDEQVTSAATVALAAFCVAFVFDWTQCLLSGLIKAVRKQMIASASSLCCMLFISLPTGYCVGVKLGLGLPGLWMGYGLSSCMLAVIYSVILIRIPWVKVAELASQEDEHSSSVDAEDSYSSAQSMNDARAVIKYKGCGESKRAATQIAPATATPWDHTGMLPSTSSDSEAASV